MAQKKKRRKENAEGDFYVDTTCIDCDTCRWIAPATFSRVGDMSAVHEQPGDPAGRHAALQALVACPTASIGTMKKAPELAAAIASFPERLDGDVHYCGFHSERSFGGASYLIVRPSGNILVDSPRFARPLVERIEALGGVARMLLTHKDDIADHEQFARHFGCERVIHADEGIGGVETTLEGFDEIDLGDDLLAIPTPGHTEGHLCYLYRGDYLFTGDHLAFSHRLGHLYAFRSACWYDWDELVASMRRLAEYSFKWVLPGHGRRFSGTSREMKSQMKRCLDWLSDDD